MESTARVSGQTLGAASEFRVKVPVPGGDDSADEFRGSVAHRVRVARLQPARNDTYAEKRKRRQCRTCVGAGHVRWSHLSGRRRVFARGVEGAPEAPPLCACFGAASSDDKSSVAAVPHDLDTSTSGGPRPAAAQCSPSVRQYFFPLMNVRLPERADFRLRENHMSGGFARARLARISPARPHASPESFGSGSGTLSSETSGTAHPPPVLVVVALLDDTRAVRALR